MISLHMFQGKLPCILAISKSGTIYGTDLICSHSLVEMHNQGTNNKDEKFIFYSSKTKINIQYINIAKHSQHFLALDNHISEIFAKKLHFNDPSDAPCITTEKRALVRLVDNKCSLISAFIVYQCIQP